MIRQATINDFEQIKEIEIRLTIDTTRLDDPNYISDMQRHGFLVQNPFTLEKFTKELNDIFLVTEIHGKIVGYVRIEKATYLEEERAAIVYRPKLLENTVLKPLKYLDRIALLPEYRGRKLAGAMLQHAITLLLEEGIGYLYSFVVVSPVTNTASIIFHDYNGFERVDISHPFTFAGFQNYQSIKYCKKL